MSDPMPAVPPMPDIPDAPDAASIPAMALRSAATWGDRPAVIDGEVRLSFADVASSMRRVAAALIAAGVEPGDRVALWAPNSATWIPAALGVQAAGAWLVPLNTRLRGDEAAYILGKVDASVLLCVEEFLGTDYEAMLRGAATDLRCLDSVVIMPGPGRSSAPGWDAFVAAGDAVDDDLVDRRIAALTPDDVSDVIFTSGTTGLPKGVMLRHGASLGGYTIYNRGYGLGEGDRHMVATPFFHCFGYKAGWTLSLMVGATTYPVAVFDAGEALELIDREGITHMPAPPTLMSALLEHPDRATRDVSSLKATMLAAASVPEVLVERVRSELGIAGALTGYGLTENHALVSVSSVDDDPHTIATTVGRIFDELEARVVDPDGNDVPLGEVGELLVRGFLLMSGYYGDPEATAAAIVDGWLHTGDVVRMHPDRTITITDRLKDIFIMGGFNVAPAEVEHSLVAMPGVAQVAVVGIPDEHFGEVGAAFVIPQAGASITADDVIAYAKAHMANYKVPRRVDIVDAFPLNATGKVLKHVLRDAAS